ncbi:hypothetical protein V6U90_33655 [Micromonospora sp. CPCC 206060]
MLVEASIRRPGPAGHDVTADTVPVWPSNVRIRRPSAASQIRTV